MSLKDIYKAHEEKALERKSVSGVVDIRGTIAEIMKVTGHDTLFLAPAVKTIAEITGEDVQYSSVRSAITAASSEFELGKDDEGRAIIRRKLVEAPAE